MSERAKQRITTKILKAVSSTTRLKILHLLLDEGPKSYTELMNRLRLNPSRDAGKFAYHLKSLISADLIEPDSKTKRYRLTDLGRIILDMTDEIVKYAYKRRKMHVRTSRLSVEEFDRSKIVESLIREADVPIELAQRIARETEKRLQQFKTKYLTAPLIREIVNAVLVEKGLEEYRHKLTRLGLPVYDVTQLIEKVGTEKLPAETILKRAGGKVLEEYTLLNVFPRDIADAYLSGYLHFEDLQNWIIKPRVTFHDLRFFLKNGFKFSSAVFPPPKSFKSALNMISTIVRKASEETCEQAMPYFNVFLAPYIGNLSLDEVKEAVKMFIWDLNQFSGANASILIDFDVPEFLSKKKVGMAETLGLEAVYGDFFDEAQKLASAILEVFMEEIERSVVLNPSLIVCLRSFKGEGLFDNLLFKAHSLAAKAGIPYFANLTPKWNSKSVYSASGFRLGSEWRMDWEVDTLRAGSLDVVFLNLPRLVYEADGDSDVFFKLLDEQLEMAFRALEIKSRWISHCIREGLLPLLGSQVDGEAYLRLGNFSRNISFLGLNEAVMAFTNKMLHETEESLETAKKIVDYLGKYSAKLVRKNLRASVSMLSSFYGARRLVELDVERYGWAKVKTTAGREYPLYTNLTAVPLNVEVSLEERLRVEEKFHKECRGGHLTMIQLDEHERNVEDLLFITRKILGSNIGFYVYNHDLSYCGHCNRVFLGLMPKCPSCGATETITHYSRLNAKLSRLKTENLKFYRRVKYMLN